MVIEILEGSADEANKRLSKNLESNTNDPKWKHIGTYKMIKKVQAGPVADQYITEEDRLVYVLHLVKKVW